MNIYKFYPVSWSLFVRLVGRTFKDEVFSRFTSGLDDIYDIVEAWSGQPVEAAPTIPLLGVLPSCYGMAVVYSTESGTILVWFPDAVLHYLDYTGCGVGEEVVALLGDPEETSERINLDAVRWFERNIIHLPRDIRHEEDFLVWLDQNYKEDRALAWEARCILSSALDEAEELMNKSRDTVS